MPDSLGAVHTNIVPLGGSEMVAFSRSRWTDHVRTSRSHDGGLTWSAPENLVLPDDNSSIQAIRLADGRIAMVHDWSSRLDAKARRLSLYDEIRGSRRRDDRGAEARGRSPDRLPGRPARADDPVDLQGQ